MDFLSQDLRYALRTLLQKRGFSLVVIITLALGIGANTAIFSVVNAVLLKPLPFRDVDRLVHIWENYPKGARYHWGSAGGYIVVRPATFFDWKRQSHSFESIAAAGWHDVLLNGEKPQTLEGHDVDESFFSTLGVPPKIGRVFQPDDFTSERRAVILSHSIWQERFGGDIGIVGKKVTLDSAAYTIIGVMPQGFYPTRWGTPQMWLPMKMDPALRESRVAWKLFTFARLKPNVSLDQAQKEMDVISDRLTAAYPSDYDNMAAVITPVTGYLFSQYESLFYTLLGAVGFVLLIACANVANLSMARITEREREFALRTSLGASRWRLICQLLTESLLLSGTGALLGVLLARTAVHPILALMPASSRLPRIDTVSLDGRVLLFTAALSILAALLFGILPAWHASASDVNELLKEGSRGGSVSFRARRIGDLLIVAEMALSVVLLVGAGFLIQTFVRLMKSDPGFRPDHVLAMQFDVPAHRYGDYVTGGENLSRVHLFDEIERRFQIMPGVKGVTVTGSLPLRHGPNPWSMHIVGKPAPPRDRGGYGSEARAKQTGLYNHGSVSIERITPGYFDTFGITLLRGRLFTARDNAAAPKVAIINEENARRYFGKDDPLGKTIIIDMTSYFPRLTIVGIVANSRLNAVDRQAIPEVFWPMSQLPSSSGWIAIRSHGDPSSLAKAAQSVVHQIDPEISLNEVKTMDQVFAESLWRQRLTATLLGTLGGLALLLAGAGVYGVFSYLVNRRVREMGVRMALGATKANILNLVLGSAMRLTIGGLVIGIVLSLGGVRLASSWISGMQGNRWLTLLGVSFLLSGVALLASYLPARRATRIEPSAALREQ